MWDRHRAAGKDVRLRPTRKDVENIVDLFDAKTGLKKPQAPEMAAPKAEPKRPAAKSKAEPKTRPAAKTKAARR